MGIRPDLVKKCAKSGHTARVRGEFEVVKGG